MKIDITTPIEIDSFNSGMREPEVFEEEPIIESSWCFLCGEGEDKHNIKVCDQCQDYFDN